MNPDGECRYEVFPAKGERFEVKVYSLMEGPKGTQVEAVSKTFLTDLYALEQKVVSLKTQLGEAQKRLEVVAICAKEVAAKKAIAAKEAAEKEAKEAEKAAAAAAKETTE